MSGTCPTIIAVTGRRKGQRCGRAVRGFVAPGHGRCGYHLTERERLTVRAILEAQREMRELRALAPEECQDEQKASGDEGAEPWTEGDVERFAGSDLGE